MNPFEDRSTDKLKALADRARASALPWLAALARPLSGALDRKLQIGIAAGRRRTGRGPCVLAVGGLGRRQQQLTVCRAPGQSRYQGT